MLSAVLKPLKVSAGMLVRLQLLRSLCTAGAAISALAKADPRHNDSRHVFTHSLFRTHRLVTLLKMEKSWLSGKVNAFPLRSLSTARAAISGTVTAATAGRCTAEHGSTRTAPGTCPRACTRVH